MPAFVTCTPIKGYFLDNPEGQVPQMGSLFLHGGRNDHHPLLAGMLMLKTANCMAVALILRK